MSDKFKSDQERTSLRIKESFKRLGKTKELSLFRIYKLIFSKKGVKKINFFTRKAIQFFLQYLTGSENLLVSNYSDWIKKNKLSHRSIKKLESGLKDNNFTISVVIVPHQIANSFLQKSITSVTNQSYSNWELIVYTSDASFGESDRVKKGNGVFKQNYLDQANGSYVLFLREGDEIEKDALLKFASFISKSTNAEVIYADHDFLDKENIRYNPVFKPGWSPDTFLAQDYIGATILYKKDVLTGIGTLLESKDALYDLCLKVSEKVSEIQRIDDVLFHFRSEIIESRISQKVIEAAILRRGEPGKVEISEQNNVSYTVSYDINNYGKVSIIIPTKNLAEVTEVCIQSIFELTDYADFEVILIDNNSSENSLFDLVKRWESNEPKRFKCIQDSGDFNFARLMNFGVSESKGDYILLLNNDTEVLRPDWMSKMVEQAQRKSIGVVGVKLIYSNDTVQHAGVILGMFGIAGHCFVGFDPEEESKLNSLTSVRNYAGLTAACFMTSKEKYLSVDGFDEKLAIEYNDIDFCMKLLDKGYNNLYIPHVSLYHYESISRGHPYTTRKSYNQSVREQGYFHEKWGDYIDNDHYYNSNLSLIFDDFSLRMND